jgi:mannan endo-1,4-beta-mannosidase
MAQSIPLKNAGFVTCLGTQFMLNGRPLHPMGTNSYYQMTYRRWRTPGPDEVLDRVAARGMTVVRTWAFQDAVEKGAGLQCAPVRKLAGSERPIDFVDPQSLIALDETLAAANARGIRVILTLVNNWHDYGGIDRWTLWRLGAVHHNRFFSDPVIKEWYRDLVSLLVRRVNSVTGLTYRDDPTIFAWELANEARASRATAGALDEWTAEMSAYIKNIDSNHLVTTGSEGFYGPAHAERNTNAWMSGWGQDFIRNHEHASIDFATCHIWPENWRWNPIGRPSSALEQVKRYLQQRLTDAQVILNKPLMCEEFGIPRDNHGRGVGSGPTTVRDHIFNEVQRDLCNPNHRPGCPCAGLLTWHILHDDYSQYDDGNGIYLPPHPSENARELRAPWDATTDEILTNAVIPTSHPMV